MKSDEPLRSHVQTSLLAKLFSDARCIVYAFNGSQLTLNWPAGQGWQLQAQTNTLGTGLSTGWGNVSGATPPYVIVINPANPTVFYRLTYP
jgi:hypothetical protein